MRDMSIEQRSGFLARLNPIETLVLAVIALLALAGLMLIGKGLLLKTQTDTVPTSGQILIRR
ncbi:hypothetical protein P6U16_18705 [Rhizobium sp. 32-5/1]|uniref:hypothetical protein n=1 Tax=Rhizobium sp. 32-5/1 TaxID=3019602 RepID=UPI00240D8B9B|nr:hypothetical protein [Rhizobium sp. 32-5/1]WEZ82958.1 hypothetical protein P6U16_18705 [Rhizobium sp. 32-5/1]